MTQSTTLTKQQLIGNALEELITLARSGSPKIRIGLMALGSELGLAETLEGARLAMQVDNSLQVVGIGPYPETSIPTGMDWIVTAGEETAITTALENALKSENIAGAVAMHYPFPVGVTTIGRLLTPACGKGMFLASSTGSSATNRPEALLRNAIYGIAVAKALGTENPTVGILNLDAANTVERALKKLQAGGYKITFGSSIRADGGALLRGNDMLTAAVDVCVCDTLTGNVLMKVFSAYSTGGKYEALGWGYGPSVGENWPYAVSIISRASGAPVISNALLYNAAAVRGNISQKVNLELKAAEQAGLKDIIAELTPKITASTECITAPSAVPTDEEIKGIDVLDLENATKALWKAGIYAEAAMGCTGPVIKLAQNSLNEAKLLLKELKYL